MIDAKDEARLLAMIEEQDPRELGPEECAALLAAARASPAIARACRERIVLEQRLGEVLGHPGLSVDAILARARGRSTGRSGTGSRVALVLGLALSALVAIVAASWLNRPANREVAAARPAAEPLLQPALGDAGAATVPSVPSADDQSAAQLPAEPAQTVAAATATATAPAASAPELVAAAEQPSPPAAQPAADAAPPPTSAAPQPDPVWQTSLRAAAGIRPSLLAFAAPAAVPPSLEVVKQWFATVPGAPGSFGAHQRGGQPAGGFKGTVRLLAPLEAGTSLRLAIHDWNAIRIHAWSGGRGVTLASCGQAGPWAGYVTSRSGDKPLPEGYVLAATDAGRMQRTHPTAPARLDLRHADGLLTLSRGDVRILDVPLATMPAEVFIEGFAELTELALVPQSPLPPPVVRLADRSVADLPALASWERVLPEGSQCVESDDGRLVLEARDNKQPARVMFRLPPGPPRAMILEIDAHDPGTGIVLGDDAGNPHHVLGFLANKQRKHVQQLELIGADGGRLDGDGQPLERPLPLVSDRCWVRLVTCGGVVRVATSPDGLHWAEFVHPVGVGSVGLSAAAHPSPRRIVLGKIWAEPFPLLASLASADLPLPPSPLPSDVTLAAWSQAAAAIRPPGAAEQPWLVACAVRHLGRDMTRPPSNESRLLAAALLDLAWQEGLARPWPAETKLELLAEIATIAPVLHNPPLVGWIAGRYEELGLRLADEGVAKTWSLVAPKLMASPLDGNQPLPCFSAWLARREAMELLVEQSPALAETAARARFYNLPGTPPLFAWAASAAAGAPTRQWEPGKYLKGPGARRKNMKRAQDLQHPVALEPTKEGITIAADVEAALSEGALADVCRALIGGLSLPPGELAPDVLDPELVLTMPAFAAALLQEHPAMRGAMVKEFEGRGGLRLRQAVDAGDASILEAVSTQYPGTASAAEASLLLGDRELAAGRFALARQRYSAARGAVPVHLASRLAASDALAAGLLGEPGDLAGEDPVSVGGATLAAAEWRKLSAELGRERAAILPLGRAAPAGTFVPALPAARNYAAAARGKLEGEVGNGPGELPGEYRRPDPSSPLHDIDWVARQTACGIAGSRLLVSNRFQLACYDSQSGQLAWRAGLGAEVGHAHAFPGQPMRPVASTTHAFVRRLRPGGPALAAIRLADGVVDWEVQPRPNNWFVASDPVMVDDVLQACTAQKVTEGWMLALGSFDPGSGKLLSELTLTLVRDAWAGQGQDCQVAWAADGLVITCGGGTISCDTAGRVRWVRQEPWVPPAVDPFWRLQAQTPPLVVDGRLYSVQPADPSVTVLDARTGRAIWKRGFAGIRRVLGLAGADEERVVVAERSGGLVALSAANGRIVWHWDTPGLLGGCLVGPDGVLLVEHEKVPGADTWRPVMVWLDAAGGIRHRCPLEGLEDPSPRIGPLVPAGNRIWALFGRGPGDPTRDLVDLSPK